MHTDDEAWKIRKVIVSTVIGGTFEWFDFMVYGYFSSTIAQVFFASVNRGESLLLTFATFAVGYLMRPIGGVVMGMYADRAGRVKALSWIMVAMSAGSLLLGLTPGFATLVSPRRYWWWSVGWCRGSLSVHSSRFRRSPTTRWRRQTKRCSTAVST